MNFKFVTYLFSITLFSFLSFFRGATRLPFLFILLILIILMSINYFYRNFYFSIIGIHKDKITKGLLYSSIIGAVLLAPLFFEDFSYTTTDSYGSVTMDLLLPLGVIIYLISIVICFSIDSFFNKEIRNAKRSRIAIGSFLFYFLLYFMNAFISLIMAGVHVLAFG